MPNPNTEERVEWEWQKERRRTSQSPEHTLGIAKGINTLAVLTVTVQDS